MVASGDEPGARAPGAGASGPPDGGSPDGDSPDDGSSDSGTSDRGPGQAHAGQGPAPRGWGRQPDSRRAAIWLAATFVGAIGIAVGNDLTRVFASYPVIFIIVLVGVTLSIGALYFFSDMRGRLHPAGPTEIDIDKNGPGRNDPEAIAPGASAPARGDTGGKASGTVTVLEAPAETSGAGDGPAPGRPAGGAAPGGAAPGGADRQPPSATMPGDGDGDEEPSPAVRWWLIVSCVALAMAVTFGYGFGLIGNGFAHNWVLGVLALAGVGLVLGAAVLLARRLPGAPGWLAWLRAWRNGVLAIGVSAIGLSSGATLGYAQLLPGPVPAAPCQPPTELRVLAASEILGPLQAAITAYEQDERARFATPCYAVDITAYAAGNDKAADDGIGGGWNLADGPRPDVWIPASSEEEPVATSPGGPQLNPLPSVASSPVVVAVPSGHVPSALHQYEQDHSLSEIYEAVKGSFTLQVPNPRLSETARLGIADLYPALSQAEQAQIGDSVSFPTDSGNLLCQSAPGKPAAYLVSAVTVAENNDGDLGASACPAQQAAQQQLTSFQPANGNGVVLDFPYITVTWPNARQSRAKTAAEQDFFQWLGKGAGQQTLDKMGLSKPGDFASSLPSPDAVEAAVSGFTRVQPSARILIAIDDSMPMRPYLGQIAQATDALLGPNGQGGNLSNRDSFGIWAFPGASKDTQRTVVPLATDSAQQRQRVPGAVAGITADGHSAEFDLVYDAAIALNTQSPADSASSLVLLTDGDNQRADLGGNDMATITNLLNARKPNGLPIKVYVIAFGPAGCAETPSGLSGDSLNALAKAGGGACASAVSGSLQQQLAQDLSALSTGG